MRSARPHPFAVPADELAELFAGKPGVATLLLPSLRSAPLDSPELVRVTPRPRPAKRPALWSIMDVLNPGMLGSSEEFRTRYAIPVERHGETEPAARLRTITRPYVVRRVKTDPRIDDLPEKIEITQHCQLTAEQASLYQSVVDDMMERIEASDGIERRGNVLAAMTKLKQVCNFTEFAELLLPHLSARFDQEVLYLHGGVPKARRDEMVERFQTGDGPPLFLLSLKAGGTGPNLTAANHVIHVDRWWNPAVENQATDRAFRIGQQRRVQVRKFVCVGTLEERIDRVIEEKKALADLVISDGERWLTELSTDALREVFALTEGAVGD